MICDVLLLICHPFVLISFRFDVFLYFSIFSLQRVENKLTSIDPVVLQEYEFLKNFIARVVSLKPNIVLVEKTVARVAQDMLLAAGITLVHNIKSVGYSIVFTVGLQGDI